MADQLRSRLKDKDRIAVIPNWTENEVIQPLPKHENPLITRWGLDQKFVVGYSGNLGRATNSRRCWTPQKG
jgi:colanic acid biosynthesis glycosyl transferase WcaI